ncbi:MAG: hypothetical protein LC620_08490 [Halobacteriales archaeon]|nr:hypothetical protein [Halobacteriales archaeon]
MGNTLLILALLALLLLGGPLLFLNVVAGALKIFLLVLVALLVVGLLFGHSRRRHVVT